MTTSDENIAVNNSKTEPKMDLKKFQAASRCHRIGQGAATTQTQNFETRSPVDLRKVNAKVYSKTKEYNDAYYSKACKDCKGRMSKNSFHDTCKECRKITCTGTCGKKFTPYKGSTNGRCFTCQRNFLVSRRRAGE